MYTKTQNRPDSNYSRSREPQSRSRSSSFKPRDSNFNSERRPSKPGFKSSSSDALFPKKSSFTKRSPSFGEESSPRRSFGGNRRESSSSTSSYPRERDSRGGGRSYGGGNRSFGGGRGNFRGGGNRFGGGGRGRQGGRGNHAVKIDITKYINKAVKVEEETPYVQQNKVSDFGFNKILLDNIERKRYVTLTPIQDQSIPHILKGRDVVGIAHTGTGKTAAFLLPLLEKVYKDPKQKVIIIAPTRELARQIDEELWSLTRNLNVFSALITGGAPMFKQISAMRRNPSFVIGTPGRLKDLIERRIVNLALFQNVVLDEADRMLEMGFIDDMRFILAKMQTEKQVLLFSASMPPKIRQLISDFSKDPVQINLKQRDTTQTVEQDVIRVRSKEEKMNKLNELLLDPTFDKVLVFASTKRFTEKIKDELVKRGFKSESIHGDKTQGKRQRALEDFKIGKVNVLVATDVAARGLDIKGVSHVINFDEPNNYEDYIHRIGRTGRANQRGIALTFVEVR